MQPPPKPTIPRSPRGVLSPSVTHAGFDRGVQTLVAAIRPTLGPIGRTVGIERPDRRISPELLDDGAEIARRVVELPDVRVDPGAMYLRGFLWRLHESTGDGTATAAVLFGALLAGGRRLIAAGVPAQPLRAALERIATQLRIDLAALAVRDERRQVLVHAAEIACHDAEIAALLGEAFDVVGADGTVAIMPSRRRESWSELVEGSYWDSGVQTATMLRDTVHGRVDLIDPVLALSDLPLAEPSEVVPILRAAQEVEAGGVVIIAESISDQVTATLLANSRPDFPIIAVKRPGFGEEGRRHALRDLAVMTGGRPRIASAGERLDTFTAADFGQARRAWATTQQFGITSGGGDARALRTHLNALTQQRATAATDPERTAAQGRLGTLHGVSATVWIGARTDAEATRRIGATTRAARAVRAAIRGGMVPGGGASLLVCRQRLLAQRAQTTDEIERAALTVVADALLVPTKTILLNAGYDPAPILASVETAGSSTMDAITIPVFDVLTGTITDPWDAGIVDTTETLIAASAGAITSAALALTIDAVVLTGKTEISVDPE